MTVATSNASINLPTDGVVTAFGYNFIIPYQAGGSVPAVEVLFTDSSGAQSSPAYSISGVNTPGGGIVTIVPAPAAGGQVTIRRNLFYTQPDEYFNQAFLPHNVEITADKLEEQIQQLNAGFAATLRFLPGQNANPIGTLQGMRGKYLAFDGATGQPYGISSPIVVSSGTTIEVASVAALRLTTGLPTSIRTRAYLANGVAGSAGLYILDMADVASPDDGAEIIVNASNGRYKLQWAGFFNFLQAGAVADGVGLVGTDNAAAILRTTYLGRKYGDKGFNLLLPPGQYNFNGTNVGYFWWGGIKNFHVSGYGATLQNTYAGGDGNLGRPLFSCLTEGLLNTSGATFHGVVAGAPLSWLINNTAVGDTSVTFITPADAGAFAVGEDILFTAVDTEWVGYPPNPALFEFGEVATVNTGTGVVTLKRPLENVYLTSYPDGGVTSIPVGKGRAWKVSSAVYYVPDPLNFPAVYSMVIPFNVNHLYEGLTLPPCPGMGITYMTIGGRNLHFKDMVMPGISPSIAKVARFTNCDFTNTSEPDKLVERIVLDECRSPVGGVGFQSSSINYVEVRGGYYVAFSPGTAKYVTLDNVNVDQMFWSSLYGLNRSIIINGGSIRNVANPAADFLSNPGHNVIDGVDVTYAAGVISVLKLSASQPFYWGLVPGTQLNLTGVADLWTGDAGTGIITKVAENATHIQYTTTFPWATVAAVPAAGTQPFTSTLKLHISRGPSPQVYGTTGSDFIRSMAEATRRGKSAWEYYKAQMVNFNTVGGDCFGFIFGALTDFNINVQQVTATAAKTMVFSGYLVKDDTIDDQKQLVITIDLTVKGRRKLNLTNFTGLVGTDAVTFNGVGITALPSGRIISAGFSWTHNIAVPGTSATIPIVNFEIIADSGMFGSTLVRNLDRTVNPITNVTGLVPS